MSKTTKRINFKEKLIDDCLELSLSGLESVPVKEIAEITKARKLNLAYNALTLLPNDFIKLQHIKEIDLSKNKLKELPKNIGQLTNLKNLDLLGNQLTDLPSSFCELKGLQWLDLKDNPLNPALKAAAGDCLDEKQCKKCAINVMNYCKQKAAEEDRLRQIESKKKKELQLKNEAEEREKANQLKLQKKQERQQKHKITEQKKREEESQDNSESNSEETSNLVGSKSSKSTSNKNSSSGFCGSIITAFLLIAVFTLLAISTYILATSYCRLPARLTIDLRKNEYVKPVLELIDEKLCPYTDKDSEFFNTIIRTLQNYFQT